MMAALDSVQRLVAPSADQGAGGAGKGEKRAVRAAVKELYGLFEALQTLMQTHSYLKVRCLHLVRRTASIYQAHAIRDSMPACHACMAIREHNILGITHPAPLMSR